MGYLLLYYLSDIWTGVYALPLVTSSQTRLDGGVLMVDIYIWVPSRFK